MYKAVSDRDADEGFVVVVEGKNGNGVVKAFVVVVDDMPATMKSKKLEVGNTPRDTMMIVIVALLFVRSMFDGVVNVVKDEETSVNVNST